VTAYVDVRTPLVNATRFRAVHEADWDMLDKILTLIEKRGVKAVPDQQLLVLPLLYRAALSSLSVARETSLDRALITYLEQLCTRAYFQIYGVPTSLWRQLAQFFTHSWPLAVQALWKETVISLLLTIAGAVVGYMLVAHDPTWYYSLIPAELAGSRDPTSTVQALQDTLYKQPTGEGQSVLAAYASGLFAHNGQIAIAAFALGFMFCVPTVYMIVSNGLTLGAIIQIFAAKGLAYGFIGWLAIHGTTEMFAIILSGAAGFRIGLAVVFPGRRSRLDAATAAGRTAAVVMGGAVVMLAIAGILEGIGRQVITSDALRYVIGGGMLVGWLVYFYLPRRNADGDFNA
jgi:uncharacterized membrane protein SpoIIM required for sporulation